MATSTVAIANGALQRLGQPRIELLTSTTDANARSMNAAFARTRDALLRKYAWSFAISRASIAADSDGTTWGDWLRYPLPADFIRLLRDDETGRRPDWRIEGQFILSSSAAPLEIRYVARVEDPNFYDACFIEAFEIMLAFNTCEEITGSANKREALRQDMKMAVAEARRIGAMEKEADDIPEDDWIAARR